MQRSDHILFSPKCHIFQPKYEARLYLGDSSGAQALQRRSPEAGSALLSTDVASGTGSCFAELLSPIRSNSNRWPLSSSYKQNLIAFCISHYIFAIVKNI
jgi:hypothetical protein